MNPEVSSNASNLSPRQEQVLQLTASGLSLAEVATALCVSVNTVKTHKQNAAHAVGAEGISGLMEWHKNRHVPAAGKRLAEIAPNLASDMETGAVPLIDDLVYEFLAGAADSQGCIRGALPYMDKLMSPTARVFLGCHIELLRLSGVITSSGQPPRPYIIHGENLGNAQDEALQQLPTSELQMLSARLAECHTLLLGVLAANGALLQKVKDLTSRGTGQPENSTSPT